MNVRASWQGFSRRASPADRRPVLAPLQTMPIYVNGAVPDLPARSVRLWQAVPGPPGQEVAVPVAVPLVEGVVARQDLVTLRVPLFAEMPLDAKEELIKYFKKCTNTYFDHKLAQIEAEKGARRSSS